MITGFMPWNEPNNLPHGDFELALEVEPSESTVKESTPELIQEES